MTLGAVLTDHLAELEAAQFRYAPGQDSGTHQGGHHKGQGEHGVGQEAVTGQACQQ